MTAEQSKPIRTLRQRAEEALKSREAATRKVQSLDEADKLLHEMRVQQIELEMQNEELCRLQSEVERLAHLKFFESMDRVNKAIIGTNDLEQLMSDVLDAVLKIFDCDRAWLIYPCDPEAASWSVPMERTKPEYPGANVRGMEIPMAPEIQRVLRTARSTDRPVPFGPGSEYPLPEWLREQFGVQSQLTMATYPKTGKPWEFGVHQCSYARVWTQEEQNLFQEINRRLADGLTGLLAYRNLLESESKYSRIVHTATEGIWALGPDNMTTFVNAQMAEMLGYSDEEINGRPMTDFMFEDDKSNHLQKMENRRHGVSENYERRFCRKDGKSVWTLASATPIFDADHAFQGSFAMFTDITERREREEEVRINIERLTMSQSISHIGSWEFNLSTGKIWGSEESNRIYGFDISAEPHPIDRVEACIPEREMVHQALVALIEREEPYDLVFAINPADGSEQKIIYSYARLVRDENDTPIKVSGVIHDITERKRAEDLLFEAQQVYRALIENSPDIIARYDRDCRRTYVNPTYLRVAKIPPQELLSTAPVQRSPLPAGSAEVLQKLLRRVLNSGVAEAVDAIWPKAGSDCWYNIFAFPEFDREERIVSVMTVSRDITEYKQAEAALNRLNEELEQRVQERTAELAAKNADLERLNRLFVGRELRMVELKQRIRELEEGDRT